MFTFPSGEVPTLHSIESRDDTRRWQSEGNTSFFSEEIPRTAVKPQELRCQRQMALQAATQSEQVIVRATSHQKKRSIPITSARDLGIHGELEPVIYQSIYT